MKQSFKETRGAKLGDYGGKIFFSRYLIIILKHERGCLPRLNYT